MKWPQKKLGQVADFLLGKMLDEKKNKGEFRPYLANVNVRWGGFELGSLREMRFELHEHERYGLQFGDIVMCEGGEPGRCAIWKNQVPGMMFQKALHRIRPKAEMDVRFLYYSFLNRGKNGGFDQYCTGSTIKHLPRQNLAIVEVDVPPLTIQKQIASILSTYDDLIENNTRRIEILEEMARRLYEEWFVQFRFPGHEGVEFKESELGLIPEDWKVSTLDEFGEIITGKTPSKNNSEFFGGVVPFIKLPDMHGNTFIIETSERLSQEGVSSQKTKTIPPGSICVSCIGTAGVVVITSEPSQTNQQINSIVPRAPGLREFLFFSATALKEKINNYGATGATMTNLSRGKFASLQVVEPKEDLLCGYNKLAAPLFDKILCLQKANRNLRAQRDLLLPKLISGEIDVSDIPMPT
jgi:type I restriction enzyme S subunit